MSIYHLLFACIFLTGITACDNLTKKSDAFSEDLEEKVSMIQSEMGAIVATGDTIRQHLEHIQNLKLTAPDTSAEDTEDIENALLVLRRKQENLENAYGSLVDEYRDILESYQEENLSQENANEQLRTLANRPASLMKNHETLLKDLVEVEKYIEALERKREEGKQQRV
ncbi:hypothetical protein AB9P05_22515 [Roseivirga sp. BDSF3-8]|uniref:hypothetical protein n=1 Tax=Roseivirga sp. BDSF3-8 TaxID=3241598 RepID=UPI003531CBB3